MLDEFTGPCAVAAVPQLSIKDSFSQIHKKRMFIVCIQVSACIEHAEQGMEEEEKEEGEKEEGEEGKDGAAERHRESESITFLSRLKIILDSFYNFYCMIPVHKKIMKDSPEGTPSPE